MERILEVTPEQKQLSEEALSNVNKTMIFEYATYLQTKDIWNKGDQQLADFLRRMYNADYPDKVKIEKIDAKTGAYLGDKSDLGRQFITLEDYLTPYPSTMIDKYSKESVEYIRSYFLNPGVLNDLSYNTRPEGAEGGLWGVNDFIKGQYGYRSETNDYAYPQGQYKIFIEPVMCRNYNSSLAIYSWRDLMLQYQEGLPSAVNAAHQGIPQLSNALKLAAEDEALRLPSDKSEKESQKLLANYPDINLKVDDFAVKKAAGENLNGLGVGVLTSPSLNSYLDVPKVIRFYVTVEGKNEDGSPIYKTLYATKGTDITYKAANATIGNAFLTNIVHSKTFENRRIEEGRALLNDIFVTDEDLTITNESIWNTGPVPSNVGVTLNFDKSDIVSYRFGLVTESDEAKKGLVKWNGDYNSLVGDISQTRPGGSVITQYYVDRNGDIIPFTYDATLNIYTFSPGSNWFSGWVSEKLQEELQEIQDENDITLGVLKGDQVAVLNKEDALAMGIEVPSNTLVMRFIVDPKPTQFNVLEVVRHHEDGTESVSRYTSNNDLDIEVSKTHTNEYYKGENFEKVVETIVDEKRAKVTVPEFEVANKYGKTPELVSWVTNETLPAFEILSGDLPGVGTGGKKGTELVIEKYPFESPITHNLYVKWKIDVYDPGFPKPFNVPEWRLSKYWKPVEEVDTDVAGMSLSIKTGCHNDYSLYPTGNWDYKVLNPAPDGSKKFATYLHSETYKYDTDSVSESSPNASVYLSGYVNAIKSTDTSGLQVANWIDSGSISGLQQYNINSAVKGSQFNLSNYEKFDTLFFKVKNLSTYSNRYAIGYRTKDGHEHYYDYRIITPDSEYVSYEDARVKTRITFDRYNQVDTNDRLFTTGSVSVKEDGKTTVKYQQDKVLNIYPEYGMLFDNDNNEESIKWVVSDKARQIKPIIYQTLDHKVYVDPVSSGVPVTDSRATRVAQSMGADKNKPIFYKGSPVNTEFRVYRDNNLSKTGMLTVKTFALDIESSVKNSWGNSSYKPIDYHTNLIGALGDIKANVEESLNVSKATNFNSITKGAIKNQKTSSYQKVKYNGSDVTEFTHELYVRGGQVIGVKLTDRNNISNYKVMSIQDLKNSGDSLYEALINMNLYNEAHDKSQTVFSTFEHKAGKTLDEGTYADLLKSTRSKFDNDLSTPDYVGVSVGSGWYSEDSTVLVVKEYVTNYNVPTTVVSDKLALGGYPELDAPIDKNLLFSKMGKGYVSLKYYFPLTIGGESTTCYFTYDSLTGHNGSKKCTYLVPNASVTDATRVN